MAAGGWSFLTKHGFPPGYRFNPTGLELISLLSDKIDSARLRPPHDRIFHDLPILAYHPKELYDGYRQDKEHRYIYFFSQRAFQKPVTGGGGGGAGGRRKKNGDHKSPRPVRVAKGGTWKASGCGKLLCWPADKGGGGGFVAGRVVTMVFYDHGGEKSNWGMHEFTVPVDKRLRLSSLPTKASYKYIRFCDLALYRLYILRSGGGGGDGDMEIENDAGSSSSLQMLADANNGHFSALSTAVAPPCLPVHQPSWGIFAAGPSTPPPPQQQQYPGTLYYHHRPAFAAAAAAQQEEQAHTMPVHGGWLPATHGAGREAGHFGAAHSPCRPTPATGSPPAEQHATATTEAQFADCFKPAAAAHKLEDVSLTGENERRGTADADESPGRPDWDLGFGTFDDHSFRFLMEEIMALGEPPATEGGGSNSGGGGSCSQPAAAGGAQQEPPAAQGCS